MGGNKQQSVLNQTLDESGLPQTPAVRGAHRFQSLKREEMAGHATLRRLIGAVPKERMGEVDPERCPSTGLKLEKWLSIVSLFLSTKRSGEGH